MMDTTHPKSPPVEPADAHDPDAHGPDASGAQAAVPGAPPGELVPKAKGAKQPPGEIGGRNGPEPTRYGDWEVGGRCTDF